MFIRSGVIFSYKLDKSGCGWGGGAHLVCVELISEKIEGSQEKRERRRRGRYKIYLLIVIRSSTSLSLSFRRCCCLVIEWKCVSHLSLLTVVLCALDRETTGRIGAENGYEWIKETRISRFLDFLARVGSWWEWKKREQEKSSFQNERRIKSARERMAREPPLRINNLRKCCETSLCICARAARAIMLKCERKNSIIFLTNTIEWIIHESSFSPCRYTRAESALSQREKGRKDNRESERALEGWKGLSLWGDPVSFMKREIFAFHHQLENCRHTV